MMLHEKLAVFSFYSVQRWTRQLKQLTYTSQPLVGSIILYSAMNNTVTITHTHTHTHTYEDGKKLMASSEIQKFRSRGSAPSSPPATSRTPGRARRASTRAGTRRRPHGGSGSPCRRRSPGTASPGWWAPCSPPSPHQRRRRRRRLPPARRLSPVAGSCLPSRCFLCFCCNLEEEASNASILLLCNATD